MTWHLLSSAVRLAPSFPSFRLPCSDALEAGQATICNPADACMWGAAQTAECPVSTADHSDQAEAGPSGGPSLCAGEFSGWQLRLSACLSLHLARASCDRLHHLCSTLCRPQHHQLHDIGVSLPSTRSPSCMAAAGCSLQSVCSRHSVQSCAGQQAFGVGYRGQHAGLDEEERQHRCDHGECSPVPQ